MKNSTATSASLGNKLAALDLTEARTVFFLAPASAKAREMKSKVSGPRRDPSTARLGYTEVEWT